MKAMKGPSISALVAVMLLAPPVYAVREAKSKKNQKPARAQPSL